MRLARDGAAKVRRVQTGAWEHLLCPSCEAFINDEYDQYATAIWANHIPNKIVPMPGLWNLAGLDYARFRLFHLSVLWRASVASRPDFKDFMFQPDDEECIRQMLLDRDPGPDDRFRLVGRLLVFPGTRNVVHGLHMAPYWADAARRIVDFAFGGCDWLCVTGEPVFPELEPLRLLPSGRMSLPICSLDDFRPGLNFMRANIRRWVSPLEIL